MAKSKTTSIYTKYNGIVLQVQVEKPKPIDYSKVTKLITQKEIKNEGN